MRTSHIIAPEDSLLVTVCSVSSTLMWYRHSYLVVS
jgi:hypothetical protein